MQEIASSVISNPLIDIAIGMMAIFLMASLLVTAAQECLAQLLSTRSKHLRLALENMLKNSPMDEADKDGSVAARFYDHHLINALKTGSLWGAAMKNPSYIPTGLFRAALLDGLNLSKSGAGLLTAIKTKAEEDDNKQNPLLQTLSLIAQQAAGDIAVFNRDLDSWFNAVMDRVNGQYKRWTQMTTFLLGLGVAIAFHVDAIRAANYLADRPAVATKLAAQLSTMLHSDAANADNAEARAAGTKAYQAVLESAGVPLGWDKSKAASEQLQIWSLPGWLITALACMLGASLWFDILKRFVSIRSSGKPPEATPDKANV
jgi:hypothetical protein